MEIYKGHGIRFRGRRLLERSFYIVHPSVIMLYYVGLFSFAFMYSNPVFIITAFAFSIILCLLCINISTLLAKVKFFPIIGLIIILITPIFNHRGATILFYFMDRPITLEAFLFGIFNTINIFTMIIAFISFNKFIDSERFLFLFSKIAPKVTFITNMSLRLNSVFKKRAQDIIDVQSLRNNEINKDGILQKAKSATVLLEVLINWCLEDGMIIAEVLKSKQYGSRKRTSFSTYKFIFSDGVYALTLMTLLGLSFFISSHKTIQYSIYKNLSPFGFNVLSWAGFLIMVAFLSFPFTLEIITSVQRRLNYEFS